MFFSSHPIDRAKESPAEMISATRHLQDEIITGQRQRFARTGKVILQPAQAVELPSWIESPKVQALAGERLLQLNDEGFPTAVNYIGSLTWFGKTLAIKPRWPAAMLRQGHQQPG